MAVIRPESVRCSRFQAASREEKNIGDPMRQYTRRQGGGGGGAGGGRGGGRGGRGGGGGGERGGGGGGRGGEETGPNTGGSGQNSGSTEADPTQTQTSTLPIESTTRTTSGRTGESGQNSESTEAGPTQTQTSTLPIESTTRTTSGHTSPETSQTTATESMFATHTANAIARGNNSDLIIVGSVVGVLVLFALSCGIIYIRRRRLRSAQPYGVSPIPSPSYKAFNNQPEVCLQAEVERSPYPAAPPFYHQSEVAGIFRENTEEDGEDNSVMTTDTMLRTLSDPPPSYSP
ncbi:hypothetical protein L218DRAFT_1006530 [Marasmius fiardii PR-910]|nr:hypothetical protein L218DRAFT_1006530 [Marasmius fiardii PR-910]